jgi:hypothetical protein
MRYDVDQLLVAGSVQTISQVIVLTSTDFPKSYLFELPAIQVLVIKT